MLLDQLIKVNDIITRHPKLKKEFKDRYRAEVRERTIREMGFKHE